VQKSVSSIFFFFITVLTKNYFAKYIMRNILRKLLKYVKIILLGAVEASFFKPQEV